MSRKKSDPTESDQTPEPEMALVDSDTPEPEEEAADTTDADPAADTDDGAAIADPDDMSDDATEEAEAGEDLSEPPATVAHIHDSSAHHEDHIDEHGSFPTWLKVLIILVFGAAIALWGGPRLATVLPSGLEPVARFLTPGSVRQAKEFEARLAALETAEPASGTLSTEGIRAAVQAELKNVIDPTLRAVLAEELTAVKAELDGLRDAISAMDVAEMNARLAAAETRLEGLDAQLGSLSEQVTGAISEGLAEQGQMSAEQAAAFQANVERLKAEISQIASQQGAIDHKIDEVAATNARLSEEARAAAAQAAADTKEIADAAQLVTALTEIEAALDSGQPFGPALSVLAGGMAEQDLAPLRSVADRGAVPVAQLQADFPALAHVALRTSMRNADDSFLGSIFAFIKSYFATRSLTPQPGKGTDAVLSRMDAALAKGDLATVLAESEGLRDVARGPLISWLDQVTALANAKAAVAEMSAQLPSLKK